MYVICFLLTAQLIDRMPILSGSEKQVSAYLYKTAITRRSVYMHRERVGRLFTTSKILKGDFDLLFQRYWHSVPYSCILWLLCYLLGIISFSVRCCLCLLLMNSYG